MARKRKIDPGIWTDEGFLELSPAGRLLWFGLISYADDEGRGLGSAKSLKAAIFPSDDLSVAEVDELRRTVASKMRVLFYTVEGQEYYQLQKWHAHQSINRPSASAIPSPRSGEPSFSECSRNAHGVISEDSVSAHGAFTAKERKKERREGSARAREEPPPETSREWVALWYRTFAERTAQLLEPGEAELAAGAKAWKRAPPDTLLASVPVYFDRDFWFTKSRAGKREYSFAGYLKHLDDVLSAMSAKPGGKPAPVLHKATCPHGHTYAVEDGYCLACGWTPGKEDDDDFGPA